MTRAFLQWVARSALRSLICIAIAIGASVWQASAATEPSIIDDLRIALGSTEEAKGDRAGAISILLEALSRKPGNAAADVMLKRVEEFSRYHVMPRTASGVFERLLRSRERMAPEVREQVVDQLAHLYRTAGEFGRAEAIERDLGYVRGWSVIGPFGYTRDAAHEQEYGPERQINLSRPESSGWRDVEWRVYEAPGSGRRVDLFGPIWPEEGCAYALAQLNSATSNDALLRLRCLGSFKIWLNDTLIADVNRGTAFHPDELVTPVALARGWNRLLVKVSAGGPVVSCRIHDEDGLAISGMRWESRLLLHDLPDDFASSSSAVPPSPSATMERELLNKDHSDADRALLHAALGILSRGNGIHEDSIQHMEKATQLAPNSPHLWYQLARCYESTDMLPRSIRRNRAREAYENASECPGGFVPSDEAIALNLHRDKKPELAIAQLKKAAKINPDNPHVHIHMAQIALDEGWAHEARSWTQNAERANSRCLDVHLLWARLYTDQRNYARAASATRQALSLDASAVGSRIAYAKLRLAGGETSAALSELKKALEVDPARISGYEELARMEIDTGSLANALVTLKAALRLSSEYPSLHRMLGEVHLRQGDLDAACAAWERALRIRPDWHELRRQLSSVKGKDADYSRPYAIDVTNAIANACEPGDYPGSDVLLIVDQTVDRVYEDGSYSEITHQVKKALTTTGAEDLSQLDIAGEILEARTYTPDGKILEPAVLPGRDTLTMPGVTIDAVIEYKFRRDHPAPKGGFFALPSWYFRSLKTPHLLSDYIVIAPNTMKLTTMARHWGRRSSGEKFEEFAPAYEGNTVLHRWRSQNVSSVLPESGHDHISTFLPHVDVGRARTWQDLNAEVLDLFLGRTRLTSALKEEARRAVGNASSCESKARAIFRHVNSIVKSDAPLYDANQILHAKAGNRGVLLVALLRAADLDARFAVARPRSEAISPSDGPGEPNWALPDPNFFSETLVCVLCDGGEKIWLDPDGPYSAFGAISARFHGGTALLLSTDGGLLTTLPWGPIREHGETTHTKISVDGTTARATGQRALVLAGSTGAAYKQLFAESSQTWRETWAEKKMNEILGGSRLTKLELPGMADTNAPFTLLSSFELAEALSGSGKVREAPAALEPLDMVKHYVSEPSRKYSLKISTPLVRWDEVSITLPGAQGWNPPRSHTEQTKFGSYSLTFNARGATIELRRTVTLMPQVIEPTRYPEFVRFCQRVDAAESAPLKVKYSASPRP